MMMSAMMVLHTRRIKKLLNTIHENLGNHDAYTISKIYKAYDLHLQTVKIYAVWLRQIETGDRETERKRETERERERDFVTAHSENCT